MAPNSLSQNTVEKDTSQNDGKDRSLLFFNKQLGAVGASHYEGVEHLCPVQHLECKCDVMGLTMNY